MKVRIIGSGITGITTAYYLAKNNHQVTIADERRYPAMATSYANGCQISASNSETWNSWKNIIHASKWLFKKDAPLLISLKPDLNKYKWFIKFRDPQNSGLVSILHPWESGYDNSPLWDEPMSKIKVPKNLKYNGKNKL